MQSTKESNVIGWFNRTVAMYKGQRVDICTVNRNDISLTRQDLVELINVCSLTYLFVI